MDRFRIVTFSKGGRPIVKFDLNDGATFTFVRDALSIDAPSRQQQFSESSRRYAGADLATEALGNAGISSEWYISGLSRDAALNNLELIVAQLESLDSGRYIEVRLDGATRSTYFPIRGAQDRELMYRWVEFAGTGKLHFKAGWIVAPLAEGERMEIGDPFDVNSLTDYTAQTGSGMAYNAGAWLETASVAEQQLMHSARGYKYGDAQVTVKFTTGGTVGAASVGAVLSQTDANNYLVAQLEPATTALKLYKKDAGVLTQLGATVTTAAIAPSTTYWLVIREEGNVVSFELWTSAPTPMGTPASSGSFTLTAGDATKYGFGSSGFSGLRLILPSPSGWKVNQFTVEPYTYRSKTLPASFTFGGSVPGDAPALTTAVITHSGGAAAPAFALLGWSTTPGASTVAGIAPFGILEGEAGTLTTWVSTADANYRGGNGAKFTTAAGASSASSVFGIDPATLVPDDFSRGEVDVEIWARVELASTLASPVLTASVESVSGTNFGPARYTQEFGSAGKLLTKPSAGTTFRFVRVGTITLAVDNLNPVKWNLRIAATWAAGGSGQFGLDYVTLAPARTRAASPTSKPNDTTYPKFVASTSETVRTIRADLSGLVAVPNNGDYPGVGLGGAPVEMPPGSVTALVKLSSLVPDDPTVDATNEQLSHTATVRFSPIPRYHVPRGS